MLSFVSLPVSLPEPSHVLLVHFVVIPMIAVSVSSSFFCSLSFPFFSSLSDIDGMLCWCFPRNQLLPSKRNQSMKWKLWSKTNGGYELYRPVVIARPCFKVAVTSLKIPLLLGTNNWYECGEGMHGAISRYIELIHIASVQEDSVWKWCCFSSLCPITVCFVVLLSASFVSSRDWMDCVHELMHDMNQTDQ